MGGGTSQRIDPLENTDILSTDLDFKSCCGAQAPCMGSSESTSWLKNSRSDESPRGLMRLRVLLVFHEKGLRRPGLLMWGKRSSYEVQLSFKEAFQNVVTLR